jgi:hypothetical protein
MFDPKSAVQRSSHEPHFGAHGTGDPPVHSAGTKTKSRLPPPAAPRRARLLLPGRQCLAWRRLYRPPPTLVQRRLLGKGSNPVLPQARISACRHGRARGLHLTCRWPVQPEGLAEGSRCVVPGWQGERPPVPGRSYGCIPEGCQNRADTGESQLFPSTTQDELARALAPLLGA